MRTICSDLPFISNALYVRILKPEGNNFLQIPVNEVADSFVIYLISDDLDTGKGGVRIFSETVLENVKNILFFQQAL